jgi:hypothetical protein
MGKKITNTFIYFKLLLPSQELIFNGLGRRFIRIFQSAGSTGSRTGYGTATGNINRANLWVNTSRDNTTGCTTAGTTTRPV